MARLDLEEASKADARGARAATAVATRENLLDTMLAKKRMTAGIKSQRTTAQERSVDGEGQRKDADKCLLASRTVSQRTKTCEVGRPDQREGEISSMRGVDMTETYI
jgi:hypothetical protein